MDTGRQQGAQQCFVVLAGEVHSICTNATAAPFFSIHNVFTFFWQLGGKNGVWCKDLSSLSVSHKHFSNSKMACPQPTNKMKILIQTTSSYSSLHSSSCVLFCCNMWTGKGQNFGGTAGASTQNNPLKSKSPTGTAALLWLVNWWLYIYLCAWGEEGQPVCFTVCTKAGSGWGEGGSIERRRAVVEGGRGV